jgi:hypothetical protein
MICFIQMVVLNSWQSILFGSESIRYTIALNSLRVRLRLSVRFFHSSCATRWVDCLIVLLTHFLVCSDPTVNVVENSELVESGESALWIGGTATYRNSSLSSFFFFLWVRQWCIIIITTKLCWVRLWCVRLSVPTQMIFFTLWNNPKHSLYRSEGSFTSSWL